MNWKLIGWLAALAGGAIVAIWLVGSVIGAFVGVLGFLIKAALVIAVVGGGIYLGLKAKKALGSGSGNSHKPLGR